MGGLGQRVVRTGAGGGCFLAVAMHAYILSPFPALRLIRLMPPKQLAWIQGDILMVSGMLGGK